jgi:hypothetical protein
MCAKLRQVLSRFVPDGAIKDAFTSSYYSLYYNRKHFKENDFYVYYRGGYFEYKFDNGVAFASYENMADELKRSLKGYLARYSLKAGDTATFEGGRAKDGARTMRCTSVTLATGLVLRS